MEYLLELFRAHVPAGAVTGLLLGLLLREWGVRVGLDALPGVRYLRPSPAAALLGGVIGATVGTAPLWVLLAAVALLRGAVEHTRLAEHILRPLLRDDGLRPAPAVVCLAADSRYSGGALTSAEQERLLKAYQVVRHGYAPRLVLTRLAPPMASYMPAVREQMSALGLDFPVEETGLVRNTHDEALAVAALASREGWSHVILVTHPWHMRRAAGVFEHAGSR